jgi:hypothetical protein
VAFPTQRRSLAANPGGAAASVKLHDEAWYETAASHHIFFAVLEGLYSDGVSNEAVDLIIPHGRFNDHFVYCCPLCHPAYEAFRLYRQRENFYGLKEQVSSFGPGLSAKVTDQLKSGDRKVRLEVIQSLIRTWVIRHLSSLKLSAAEREKLEQQIISGQENGMAALEKQRDPGWPIKGCAICDGCVEGCKLAPKPSR